MPPATPAADNTRAALMMVASIAGLSIWLTPCCSIQRHEPSWWRRRVVTWAAALAVEFSAEDLKRIDAIIAPGTHVAPFYEADFSASRYRW